MRQKHAGLIYLGRPLVDKLAQHDRKSDRNDQAQNDKGEVIKNRISRNDIGIIGRKQILEVLNPTHSLWNTLAKKPSGLMRKSLNASTVPNMGKYAKIRNQMVPGSIISSMNRLRITF